jgi:hypothetical protein
VHLLSYGLASLKTCCGKPGAFAFWLRKVVYLFTCFQIAALFAALPCGNSKTKGCKQIQSASVA